uniref:Uncharacterized protein n=1 Tax=Cacopsylla melanoneura TaxID=428564 RepID=A0A8D8RQ68_9HEMI
MKCRVPQKLWSFVPDKILSCPKDQNLPKDFIFVFCYVHLLHFETNLLSCFVILFTVDPKRRKRKSNLIQFYFLNNFISTFFNTYRSYTTHILYFLPFFSLQDPVSTLQSIGFFNLPELEYSI